MEVETKTVKLSAIKLNPDNPRKIAKADMDRLVKSLVDFPEMMELREIVCDENNVVLGGNMRLQALRKAEVKECTAKIVTGLTEAQKREFVIKDNSNFGVYDWDILKSDWSDLPLDSWGVELSDDWAAEPDAPKDAEPQIDRAEELNKIWKVNTGDLWQIGEHRLLCGDSTKADDVARVMGGEKAAVVSDPPYGISVDTSWLSALNVKRGKPSNKSDNKLANDDGTLDLSFTYQYPEWLVFGFPFVARNEKYTGLLVWDKRGDGGEDGLGNPVEVAASNAFNGYRLARHVWAGYIREAGEKREPHPTQKPIGIMVDAIQLVKNQIILDPFLGSGTTMVACQNLNRKCRGIEISPDYCAVILQRMTDAFPDIEIKKTKR